MSRSRHSANKTFRRQRLVFIQRCRDCGSRERMVRINRHGNRVERCADCASTNRDSEVRR